MSDTLKEHFTKETAIKKLEDRLRLLEARFGLEWSESNGKYYKVAPTKESFVTVQQFMDIDRNPHIIVMTRNQVLEYDPTGKSKLLFTLQEAENAPKRDESEVEKQK